jgi:hypothetical protein
MEHSYPFEVFAYYPRPRKFESYTGYLTRIAEGNNIASIDGLATACFPNQDRRVIRALTDFPPVSYGTLPIDLQCSEGALSATTLYHVVAKFDRSTHPQAASRFLAGHITPYLRLCPRCLAEHGCYLLTWRFSLLPGCPNHGCQLIDTCPRCNQQMPPFSAPFRIGVCPNCEFDLRNSPLISLTSSAQQEAAFVIQDLEFLLTEQTWETDSTKIMIAVGRVLASQREQRELSHQEFAQGVGITTQIVTGIERANKNKGAAFNEYVRSIYWLGITFRDVFNQALHWKEQPSREDELLQKVKRAHETLKFQGNPTRQKDIGDLIGMSPGGMRHYPSVAEFLAKIGRAH